MSDFYISPEADRLVARRTGSNAYLASVEKPRAKRDLPAAQRELSQMAGQVGAPSHASAYEAQQRSIGQLQVA